MSQDQQQAQPTTTQILAQQGEDAAIYQQEIARLLDYIKNGELTLREAANIAEGLALTTDF